MDNSESGVISKEMVLELLDGAYRSLVTIEGRNVAEGDEVGAETKSSDRLLVMGKINAFFALLGLPGGEEDALALRLYQKNKNMGVSDVS